MNAVTQEQLAEVMGVSNRTVSRWETGSNMPDLDVLIDIANYYKVDVGEILDGERKDEKMDKNVEETVLKAADYSSDEKTRTNRRTRVVFIIGAAAMIVYMIFDSMAFAGSGVTETIRGFSLGLAFGALIGGIILTSSNNAKIRAFKARLLRRQ